MARLVVKNEQGDERTSLQLLERMVRAIEEAEKERVPVA